MFDKKKDVKKNQALKLSDKTFPVTVNYDLLLEDAVKAGNYDWVNGNVISKNFPSYRKGMARVEIVLVDFDRRMKSEDVIHKLNEQGLRPAELPELLAFGATYHNKYGIVALGSAWSSPDCYCRYVPFLFWRHGVYLGLGLYTEDEFFPAWKDDGYRFAALYK